MPRQDEGVKGRVRRSRRSACCVVLGVALVSGCGAVLPAAGRHPAPKPSTPRALSEIVIESLTRHGGTIRVNFHVRSVSRTLTYGTGGGLERQTGPAEWTLVSVFTAGFANAEAKVFGPGETAGGPSIAFTAAPGADGPPEWVDLSPAAGAYRLHLTTPDGTSLTSRSFSLR